MAKIRTAPRHGPERAVRAAGGVRGHPRAVGRRRSTRSPFAFVTDLVFRRETVGALLVVVAALAVPWLVPIGKGASGLRDDLVQGLGIHVFLLVALLGWVGWLVLRRSLAESLAQWRPWLAGAGAAVFSLGVFGFWRPEWELGSTSLAEVTAGGDLGHALASTGRGLLVWMGSGAAAVVIGWPQTSLRSTASPFQVVPY